MAICLFNSTNLYQFCHILTAVMKIFINFTDAWESRYNLYSAKITEKTIMELVKKVVRFYIDGFKNMTLGKSLWIMIILKVIFLIIIMKVLFFPNFLSSNFSNDEERSSYVRQTLATPNEK